MQNTAVKQQHIALVALFNTNQQLLLLKRLKSAHCGGLWSFPGGKVESSESPLIAAQRELFEETRLIGENWQALGKNSHHYSDRNLHFTLFSCRCSDFSALKAESSHVWATVEQLNDYPMPEANQALIQLL
ncbi:MAG: NUDIX domain-containing protein [Mariprofundaceae bacterium]